MIEDFYHKQVKQYILCAALHIDDGEVYPKQPDNIKTGFIVCGRRHDDCFYTIAAILGCEIQDVPYRKQIIDGFMTSDFLFVTRKEASKIAFDANQINKDRGHLISEDLY